MEGAAIRLLQQKFPRQLVKRFYLPDWMSFAPVELDSDACNRGFFRLLYGGIFSSRVSFNPQPFWNPEFTINKHFLTCDEKCRIKGEISSLGNPAGTHLALPAFGIRAQILLTSICPSLNAPCSSLAVGFPVFLLGSWGAVSLHSVWALFMEVVRGVSQ